MSANPKPGQDQGQRRRCLRLLGAAGALAALGLPAGRARAAAPGKALSQDLPSPDSLATALAAALARQQPLVLMASLAGCPFCHVVRSQYLWPLVHGGGAVVQVSFRDDRSLLDWQGRRTTQARLVADLGIAVAPTLLFFGPAVSGAGARELAPRLEGASIPDFYGAYLDDRLAQARAALRAQADTPRR